MAELRQHVHRFHAGHHPVFGRLERTVCAPTAGLGVFYFLGKVIVFLFSYLAARTLPRFRLIS